MADIKKLEKELWEAADNLRANSKLTSQQYCMPVLGLIFLRYAWGRFKIVDAQIKESRACATGRQVPIEVADYTKRGAMFLPEEARYDYLLTLPENETNIGKRVNDAMTALERQNPQLAGVLPRTYTDLGSNLLRETLRIFNNPALEDAIYREVTKRRDIADTGDVMVQLKAIIDEHIEVHEVDKSEPAKFDISAIDFDLLHREFEKKTEKNLLFGDMRAVIEHRLEVALQQNPTRADFFKRYESIIDQYSKEQDRATIEATFEALMKLSQDLDDEQKRYVREGFTSEEQLTVFDMIYKDTLSKEDIKKAKALCVELVEAVRKRLSQMSHWTEKPETLAEVDTLIRDELCKLPEQSYPDDSITEYRKQIFDCFYSRAA